MGSSERRSLERLFSAGCPGVQYRGRILERGLTGSRAAQARLMARRAERLERLQATPEEATPAASGSWLKQNTP